MPDLLNQKVMPPDSHDHFSSILAFTVHEIKNSLGVQQQLIHKISSTRKEKDNPDFIQLEFEARRMNHSMMQLLVLYKIDSDRFSLDIEENPAIEIFNEVEAQQSTFLQYNRIHLNIQCPDDLMSFCDYTHICNALGTILNNAQRYCKHQILLSADRVDDFVCFTIEDDGVGYPQNLLSYDPHDRTQMDWVTGSTGLGLFFVSTIAELHQNNQDKGFIRIDNDSRLGGARFRLFLP